MERAERRCEDLRRSLSAVETTSQNLEAQLQEVTAAHDAAESEAQSAHAEAAQREQVRTAVDHVTETCGRGTREQPAQPSRWHCRW